MEVGCAVGKGVGSGVGGWVGGDVVGGGVGSSGLGQADPNDVVSELPNPPPLATTSPSYLTS